MTILILLFRMSSQSRGASLSKKIISIQRNNNYKKCGLYSVASPPLSSSRLLIYKGVLCDKIWVFFSLVQSESVQAADHHRVGQQVHLPGAQGT